MDEAGISERSEISQGSPVGSVRATSSRLGRSFYITITLYRRYKFMQHRGCVAGLKYALSSAALGSDK